MQLLGAFTAGVLVTLLVTRIGYLQLRRRLREANEEALAQQQAAAYWRRQYEATLDTRSVQLYLEDEAA